MQNKHPIITYAYHFISESIILFLVCLPIMYYHFNWVPYASFLMFTIVLCILFSIFTKLSNSYIWYIISAPFIILVFYGSGYPIVLSIVFSIALTWRYINIRRESILNREMGYIQVTLVLATAFVLLMNDYQIILYAFLQFLILIIGYISSHLTVIQKEERKRFDKKLWLYIGFMLAAGSATIFLLFDSGRYVFLKLGKGLSYVAAVVSSKMAVFFQFLDFNKVQLPGESSPMQQQENQLGQLQQGHQTSLIEKIMPYIYWAIAMIVIALIIFLVIRFFKNKFRRVEQVGVSDAISYGDLDDKSKDNRSFMNKLFATHRKPSHPVRKVVYQFERKAAKSKYGRNSFETLEDWLARLGIDDNLDTYQKVRYGKMDVNESEVNALIEKLKVVESKFDQT